MASENQQWDDSEYLNGIQYGKNIQGILWLNKNYSECGKIRTFREQKQRVEWVKCMNAMKDLNLFYFSQIEDEHDFALISLSNRQFSVDLPQLMCLLLERYNRPKLCTISANVFSSGCVWFGEWIHTQEAVAVRGACKMSQSTPVLQSLSWHLSHFTVHKRKYVVVL